MMNDFESRKSALIALARMMDDNTIMWTLAPGASRGCFHGNVSVSTGAAWSEVVYISDKYNAEVEFSVTVNSIEPAKMAIWFTYSEIKDDPNFAELFGI